MMAKIQRFGGAMFGPVIFFIFSGVIVSLASVFQNPNIVGSIANEGTLWTTVWNIIETGGWTVFNNMEILFVIGLPIGLAKMAHARAAMESFVLYMTFNNFIAGILSHYGSLFGIDYSAEIGGQSGLTLIGGVKTLDTGVIGAIVIASVSIYLHNRFFEKKLPEYLGVFQGSALIGAIGFIVMLPIAFLTSWIWPMIQHSILSIQVVMVNSGNFGVFSYIFLEKILLPTGLHHFIYTPFQYGPAVVEGGTTLYWMQHIREFSASTQPLKTLFPEGGFAMQGVSNLFGVPGIALAFYATAKKKNKKKVLALLIPGVLTAVFAGITEPFDYTFLFIAPILFLIHALLAASMVTTMYIFGVVGDMQGGLIELVAKNIIPMSTNHWKTYVLLFAIGFIFTLIYFLVFRFLILKFNFMTPGRENDTTDVSLYTKKDYKEKKNKQTNSDAMKAQVFLTALGGSNNIDMISNCATRLRVSVFDESLVGEDELFTAGGAHGIVRNGKSFQVIVGLSVPQLREEFERLVNESNNTIDSFNINNITSGTVHTLEDSTDEMFSSKMMGEGYYVTPDENDIYSPVEGIISNIFPTKHALAIRSKDGLEVLIHIGVDTVSLNGEPFKVHVKEGQSVDLDTKLVTVDFNYIIKKEMAIDTFVIITNLKENDIISDFRTGNLNRTDLVLTINKK